MKKNIRVSEPSPEMQEKIRRARCAIVNQKMRMVKCPYCGYEMPLRLSQTADCKGVFIKCKGKNCKQIFEIKINNGKQVK